jgi:hypothetical protein
MPLNPALNFPDDLGEALDLINSLFGETLSIVDADGVTHGYFSHQEELRRLLEPYIQRNRGSIQLYDGEIHVDIRFTDIEHARHFVKGISLPTTGSPERRRYMNSFQRSRSTSTQSLISTSR